MRVLGIDPGGKGALALLVDGRLHHVVDMPTRIDILSKGQKRTRIDTRELALLVRTMAPHAVFIELVGAMPGEGPVGAFAFGRNFGALEGAVGAIGLKATLVPPQTWQRAMRLRRATDGTKAASRKRAGELYPDQRDLFARVKDDGRADAVLLATYGHNELTNL